ncbi:MAG: oligosaccharide flippase family protein, partial [bacterium]|nr:oligosaccharide flippase family protein [bacterium]
MLFRTVFGINKSRLDLKFINFRLIKNIFKASSQISVSTVIVFACSFLKNKIFAIYLGVAGIGIVSQLTSFINLLNFVVPLGIPNGLSKYVAEKDLYQSNELKVLFNNSLNLVIAPTIIAAIFIFFFANWISVQLFSSEDFTLYVKIIAILMPFVIFNSLFEGFFRSLDRINLYVKLNIFANIFGIFVIVLGTILFGLLGGLVGILSINIVYVFLSIYFVIKLDIFSFKSFNLKIEKEFLVKLIKVSFVFLVSGGLFQLTLLIIRKTIISDFGIYYNGIYQSTIAVSLNYFGFIFLSLSTYSVPIISKLFSKDDINNELNLNIRYINLLIVPLVAIAFISRYLIIAVLYS